MFLLFFISSWYRQSNLFRHHIFIVSRHSFISYCIQVVCWQPYFCEVREYSNFLSWELACLPLHFLWDSRLRRNSHKNFGGFSQVNIIYIFYFVFSYHFPFSIFLDFFLSLCLSFLSFFILSSLSSIFLFLFLLFLYYWFYDFMAVNYWRWLCSWVIAPCGCRQCCRRFVGTCCIHLQGISVEVGEFFCIHINVFWKAAGARVR
jgi:hypothetical protein